LTHRNKGITVELNDKDTEMLFAWMRRLEGKFDALHVDMGEVKLRLSSLEIAVAGLGREVANQGERIAHQWHALDQHGERLARLEKRTGLIEGEPDGTHA
jgi:hypothetical protein